MVPVWTPRYDLSPFESQWAGEHGGSPWIFTHPFKRRCGVTPEKSRHAPVLRLNIITVSEDRRDIIRLNLTSAPTDPQTSRFSSLIGWKRRRSWNPLGSGASRAHGKCRGAHHHQRQNTVVGAAILLPVMHAKQCRLFLILIWTTWAHWSLFPGRWHAEIH